MSFSKINLYKSVCVNVFIKLFFKAFHWLKNYFFSSVEQILDIRCVTGNAFSDGHLLVINFQYFTNQHSVMIFLMSSDTEKVLEINLQSITHLIEWKILFNILPSNFHLLLE